MEPRGETLTWYHLYPSLFPPLPLHQLLWPSCDPVWAGGWLMVAGNPVSAKPSLWTECNPGPVKVITPLWVGCGCWVLKPSARWVCFVHARNTHASAGLQTVARHGPGRQECVFSDQTLARTFLALHPQSPAFALVRHCRPWLLIGQEAALILSLHK